MKSRWVLSRRRVHSANETIVKFHSFFNQIQSKLPPLFPFKVVHHSIFVNTRCANCCCIKHWWEFIQKIIPMTCTEKRYWNANEKYILIRFVTFSHAKVFLYLKVAFLHVLWRGASFAKFLKWFKITTNSLQKFFIFIYNTRKAFQSKVYHPRNT